MKEEIKNLVIAIESIVIVLFLVFTFFNWLYVELDLDRSFKVKGFCSYMDGGNITINHVTYPVGNVFGSVYYFVNKTIEVKFDYKDGVYYFSEIHEL